MATLIRLAMLIFAFSPVMIAASPAAATPTRQATPVAGEGYAQPAWLVEANWLRENRDTAGIRVVALTPAEDYEAGHIPGAAQIDWPALEVTDTSDPSIAQWQDEVETILTDLGIRPDDPVVIYDDGTLFAARLWWILHQLGHKDKAVLNGGFAAWEASGGEVETGAATIEPAAEPYVGTPRPEVLAQLAEVEKALKEPNVAMVDARSPKEYADGHIPGAVNVEFTRNAAPDEPKYWKSAQELREMYAEAGVTPDKMVIPYCTTGVRSAVTYFTLGLIGYDDVSLFTGSWAEWSSYPELPVATGDAP